MYCFGYYRYIWCSMRQFYFFVLVMALAFTSLNAQQPYVVVLGVAQDGGYPHIGCKKICCQNAWKQDSLRRYVVSLAIVDPSTKRWWLFEATPDIKFQLEYFNQLTSNQFSYLPQGVFLTHAHIGHYAGLMQLGKEALNSKNVKAYCMPRMANYLNSNGPWSQLVSLKNIDIDTLEENNPINLSDSVSVIPFQVPHRDEYSETVGYKMNVGSKLFLFIPDINKWNVWKQSIVDEVKKVDYAFIDATFYDENELPGVRMESVPHPFVQETIKLFENETNDLKSKIRLIHFNHTNPLLYNPSKVKQLKEQGFSTATQGDIYK